MRSLRLPLLGLLLLVSLSLPFGAAAQTNTIFDPIIPEACKCREVPIENADGSLSTQKSPSAPGWGCVIKVVQNVINTAVGIAVIVVVLALVYAGFMLMTSGGKPDARTKARNLVTNAVVGIFVLLGAWLGVDFIMKMVYDPTKVISGDTRLGPWHTILGPSGASGDLCLIVRQPQPIATGVVGLITEVINGPSGGGGAGSCTVPPSGPCSVAALQAFGQAASQAAQICTAESTGDPTNESRSDRLADGRAYSIGLFQINLTNSFNHRVNGRNCSDAFTGTCQGRAVVQSGSAAGRCSHRVRDIPFYNQCVAAAKNPQINIAAARALYDGDWGRWSTARTCNLPR